MTEATKILVLTDPQIAAIIRALNIAPRDSFMNDAFAAIERQLTEAARRKAAISAEKE
jgi:hypothetical protein